MERESELCTDASTDVVLEKARGLKSGEIRAVVQESESKVQLRFRSV